MIADLGRVAYSAAAFERHAQAWAGVRIHIRAVERPIAMRDSSRFSLDGTVARFAGLYGPVTCRGLRNACYYGCKYQYCLCLCWLLQLLPLLGHIIRCLCAKQRPAACYGDSRQR